MGVRAKGVSSRSQPLVAKAEKERLRCYIDLQLRGGETVKEWGTAFHRGAGDETRVPAQPHSHIPGGESLPPPPPRSGPQTLEGALMPAEPQ